MSNKFAQIINLEELINDTNLGRVSDGTEVSNMHMDEYVTLEEEIESMIDITDDTIDTANNLQEQQRINEDVLSSDKEVTVDDVISSQEALYLALGRLGMPKDRYGVSVEGYMDNRTRLTVSNEGVKDILVMIWEKIKAFFKTIKDKIVKFFRWIFRLDKDTDKKMKDAKKTAKDINKMYEDIPITKLNLKDSQIDEILYKVIGFSSVIDNDISSYYPGIRDIGDRLKGSLAAISYLSTIVTDIQMNISMNLNNPDYDPWKDLDDMLSKMIVTNNRVGGGTLQFDLDKHPSINKYFSLDNSDKIINTHITFDQITAYYITSKYELNHIKTVYSGRNFFKEINPDFDKFLNSITVGKILSLIEYIPGTYDYLQDIQENYDKLRKKIEQGTEKGTLLAQSLKDIEQSDKKEVAAKIANLILQIQTSLLYVVNTGCQDIINSKNYIINFINELSRILKEKSNEIIN